MAPRRIRITVVGLLVALFAQSLSPTSAVAQAQPAPCSVGGPAQQYAPTIDDFGRRGQAFMAKADADYWGGQGFLFGFQRGEWEAMMSNPWGSSLWGGVVVAASESDAASDLRNAVEGWTEKWTTFEEVAVPPIGDEAVAVRRLTPWEIDKEQPMAEIFLAFRRCNATAHFLLATMPEFDAVSQALRYARLVDARMRG